MSSSNDAGPSYTVLRIKRKATEPPLSSLVIEDRSTRGIKKRLISSRGRGVFRLAETVPETWAGRGVEAETLKQRIRGLLSGSSGASEDGRRSAGSSSGPVSTTPGPRIATQPLFVTPTVPGAGDRESQPATRPPRGTAREDAPKASPTVPIAAPQPVAAGPIAGPSSTNTAASSLLPPRSSSLSQQGATQYRVVRPPSPRTRSQMPPRVLTDDDLRDQRSPFNFIDAQAVPSPAPGVVKSPVKVPTAEEEQEMASFLPMLQEYLKLEESKAEEAAAAARRRQRSPSPDAETEEYVYDLYYRDVRDTGVQGLGVGDGVTGSTAVGALLDYELFSPPSSPSSSEPEDEADEDSNEEDFYRNDYPEDEDADEDMREYEHSGSEDDGDSSDDMGGGGSGDHDGGMWNYR